MIVPANVYESLIANTEFLSVTDLEPRVTRSGSVFTVYKRDDTTSQYTNTATTDASAEPIVGMSGS